MLGDLVRLVVLQSQTDDILRKLLSEESRKPTILKFDVPILLSKRGIQTMSGTVTFTDDHDLRVPLKWADDIGAVHPFLTGTVVTSDNVAVVSGGDVSADGTSVVLRSVGDGTANVTITNGDMHDTIVVTIGVPVALSLTADAADATPVPKGTAA